MIKPSGIFMDRDGLINVAPPPEDRYLLHPDKFVLMPGIAKSIRLLNERQIPVAIITNQKGVAIGKMTEETLLAVNQRMCDLLMDQGATVQNIQYCPHQESDNCVCRKPLPGMIMQASKILDIDPTQAWMLGDQPRDIVAGRAAGCKTLLISPEPPPNGLANQYLPSTKDLPRWIEEKFPFQP